MVESVNANLLFVVVVKVNHLLGRLPLPSPVRSDETGQRRSSNKEKIVLEILIVVGVLIMFIGVVLNFIQKRKGSK